MKRLLLLVMKMLFDVIQLIDRLTQELKNYLRLLLFGEMREREKRKKQEQRKKTHYVKQNQDEPK